MVNWVSPQLGIRFDWQPKQDLIIYDPMGDRFLSPLEIDAKARRNESKASQLKARAENAEYQLAGIQIDNTENFDQFLRDAVDNQVAEGSQRVTRPSAPSIKPYPPT